MLSYDSRAHTRNVQGNQHPLIHQTANHLHCVEQNLIVPGACNSEVKLQVAIEQDVSIAHPSFHLIQLPFNGGDVLRSSTRGCKACDFTFQDSARFDQLVNFGHLVADDSPEQRP
jgi:hypothetical protein